MKEAACCCGKDFYATFRNDLYCGEVSSYKFIPSGILTIMKEAVYCIVEANISPLHSEMT